MRASEHNSGQVTAAALGEPIPLAIVFADLAGYSRMMSQNETATLEFIVECSHLIRETSLRFRGELVQTTGDGYFLLFPDPVDALTFGVELHRLVAKRQSGLASPARFRVGIHQGLVYRCDGMHHGHAVNIAARLEPQANPGSCTVSQDLYEAVRHQVGYRFEAAGQPPLKNIPERIQLYRVVDPELSSTPSAVQTTRVVTIGPLTVRNRDRIASFATARKQAALLGYLSLTPAHGDHMEKLVTLLWPDKSAAAARRALADCQRQVARNLQPDLSRMLVKAKGWLGLDELAFETDLDDCLRQLRQGTVPPILYEEPDWPQRILQGTEAVSPVFASWLKVMRASWQARILAALNGVTDRVPPQDVANFDAARAVLVLEPGNETASNAVIQYHAARGNRAGALEEFERLERYLHDRHNMAPNDSVRATVDGLQSGQVPEQAWPAGPDAASRAVAPAPQRSNRLLRILVEPFWSGEHGPEHRVAGFREELVGNLARFREWAVAELETRGETGASKDTGGADRGGHYLVRGTALESQGASALRVALVSLSDGRVVWSEDFQLEIANWAVEQRDAIAKIAACLETYISADRLNSVMGSGVRDATSHDAWLRAERVFDRWTPDASDEAEAILQDVIARDDGFAPAYASLASYRNVRHVVFPGEPRDAELGRRSRTLAARAVELDPMHARNQLAMAWTAMLDGAFDHASIHLDLAASLNPNSPTPLLSCAMGYAFLGQPERAETLVRHVLRISPMLSDWHWCYVASVHFFAGRYEEALSATERSGDRIFDNPGWRAAALSRLGRLDEARVAFESLVAAVRPVWSGPGQATPEAVFRWFTGAYPVRKAEDRARLSDALVALVNVDPREPGGSLDRQKLN